MAKWLQANVTALDFSENGLHVVTELFRANDCTLRLIAADLTTWQPDEQFDVVVHWGVLEHFVDPRPLLEKSAAALKPGGTLLFSMPNMEALAARLWERWSPDNWQKHVMHSDDLVVRTLADLGLTGVRAFHFGVPFFKMGLWERRSPLQVPISALQMFGSATARVLPIFHRFGWRRLSMERGFIARRAA
jgi:SAM-dependent methyltransferase